MIADILTGMLHIYTDMALQAHKNAQIVQPSTTSRKFKGTHKAKSTVT